MSGFELRLDDRKKILGAFLTREDGFIIYFPRVMKLADLSTLVLLAGGRVGVNRYTGRIRYAITEVRGGDRVQLSYTSNTSVDEDETLSENTVMHLYDIYTTGHNYRLTVAEGD